MDRTVESTAHGERSVYVKFHKSRSRMFNNKDMKRDTMIKFCYNQEEEGELKEAIDGLVLPKTKYYMKGPETGAKLHN